jgi:tetrapyrrole methylase family protein/MazG family protein
MSDAFDRLVAIMDRLRDPGGCPWDREQTLETLAGYLLEEAYEVVEAVHAGDGAKVCEELGDLLLQIVFMSRIGREKGWFDVDSVCETISAKMVRRHPHVFGELAVADAGEVVRNWEDIKQREREGAPEAARSALDGVPAALPALLKAYRVTQKAAALGFDWERPEDVVVKLREEVSELEAELDAPDGERRRRVRAELGDVLFVMANLARHLGVEPETALQTANVKFIRRFRGIEERAAASGRSLREMSLAALDELWDQVKAAEGERGSD